MKRIISLLLLAMVTVVLFSCGEKIPQKEPTNSDYNSNPPVSADDSLPEEFTMSILDTGYKVIERDKRYSVGVVYTYEALQEYVDRVIYGFDLFAEQTVLRNPSPERLRGFMPALNELMDQILLIQSFDEAFFEKNDLVWSQQTWRLLTTPSR